MEPQALEPDEGTSKRVLVAVQPPWTLTEKDLLDFVWAPNVREVRFARKPSPPFDFVTADDRPYLVVPPIYGTWDCVL